MTGQQPAALAGTQRAYDQCPACRHARVRHPAAPGGHCTGNVWATVTGADGVPRDSCQMCVCTLGQEWQQAPPVLDPTGSDEPVTAEHDPGPAVDDEGGMSEYRNMLVGDVW